MNEPILEPTPRSRIEKIDDSNILTFLPSLLVIGTAINPLMEKFGFWLGLVVAIAISTTLTIILTMPMIPAKKRRVAMDAEHGIFECAHREPSSVLKRRWARGYAKAEPDRGESGHDGVITLPIDPEVLMPSLTLQKCTPRRSKVLMRVSRLRVFAPQPVQLPYHYLITVPGVVEELVQFWAVGPLST